MSNLDQGHKNPSSKYACKFGSKTYIFKLNDMLLRSY